MQTQYKLLWLVGFACLCVCGTDSTTETTDDVMTEENLAQLQQLLVKYHKYKHEMMEAEAASKPKTQRRHAKKQKHVEEDGIEETAPRRRRKSKKATLAAKKRVKVEREAADSCCGGCDSDGNDESMYSYVVNSLYSWYYGDDAAKAEKSAETSDNDDELSEEEEQHMAKIAHYITSHGHSNVDKLKEKDMRKLLRILHAKEGAQHMHDHDDEHQHHNHGGHHHHNHGDHHHHDEEDSPRFSACQKGIIAGVISALALLLIAGVVYFVVRQNGVPSRLFKRPTFATRRPGDRELPLRATGPNVTHIYPAP